MLFFRGAQGRLPRARVSRDPALIISIGRPINIALPRLNQLARRLATRERVVQRAGCTKINVNNQFKFQTLK